MKYRVRHTTRYDYSEEVPICYNQARLTPRNTPRQQLVTTALEVLPVTPVPGRRREDYFGNEVTYFTVQDPHKTLSIVVTSDVLVAAQTKPGPRETMAWDAVRVHVATAHKENAMLAYQFAFDSLFARATPELERYARESFPAGRPLLEGVLDLTRRIHAEFTYDPTATTIATPLEE
ncbi:MAG: transglutaminase family protein, partial [Candidatus Hydrogenedentes bacterium]|nr:transglutaminase family protein [Candidatus Hydrogenedentota bacterium]